MSVAGGKSEYYSSRNNSLITSVSLGARKKVYDLFFARFQEAEKILDVGVTSEMLSPEANFLEKWFPHPNRLTAVGIENVSVLQAQFPGVSFKQISAGEPLPFAEASFDVAFSHAVIEHVVEDSARREFVGELLRVARRVFITTPNKFFPIEPHTKMPLLHFFCPSLFYWLLENTGWFAFYRRTNLRLFSKGELANFLSQFKNVRYEIKQVRTFGFTSNLVAILERT